MTRPFYAIQSKAEEFLRKTFFQILDFHSAWYRDYLVHYLGILVGVKRRLQSDAATYVIYQKIRGLCLMKCSRKMLQFAIFLE